jgi:hypothetical protein
MYFSTQHVEYKGIGGAAYLIIVCDTIKFTGNSSISSDYVSLETGSPVKVMSLVE